MTEKSVIDASIKEVVVSLRKAADSFEKVANKYTALPEKPNPLRSTAITWKFFDKGSNTSFQEKTDEVKP